MTEIAGRDPATNSGTRLDALVAERVKGWGEVEFPEVVFARPENQFSQNISAAWTVDKPEWRWQFLETPAYLQVTLYPNLELWNKRPGDFQIVPDEIITENVRWDECATKAEAYALGRCRAALAALSRDGTDRGKE